MVEVEQNLKSVYDRLSFSSSVLFFYVAEINLPNYELTIEQCVSALIRMLETAGILTGAPSDPSGLPMPDGDEIIDLHVDPRLLFLQCFLCYV